MGNGSYSEAGTDKEIPGCDPAFRRVHDLGHWHPNVNSRVIALGACRHSMPTREALLLNGVSNQSTRSLPCVFHMGDEVGSLSEPWRSQMSVEVATFLATLHGAARLESGRFTDANTSASTSSIYDEGRNYGANDSSIYDTPTNYGEKGAKTGKKISRDPT